jgi:carbon monoxide dehydrogenase subunit G
MIEAEHTVQIDANIDGVWDYVQDIRRWANLFPGCQDCTVIDENDSLWTIKVGVGGMVRTVNIQVHVDQWDGPQRVNFSYKLKAEPVVGSGSYSALQNGPNATEVKLGLRVEGSGQMAPMWEAMCRPLMPQLAKSFAGKLKNEIEGTVPPPSVFARMGNWLRKLWQSLFGSRSG